MPPKHHLQPPEQTDKARRLCHQSTLPERMLWGVLRDRRFAGIKFRRQYPVGPYVVDFYCHSAHLAIEIDGSTHDLRYEYDQWRTAFLERQGLQVFRVSNQDVLEDVEAVARGIAQVVGVVWD